MRPTLAALVLALSCIPGLAAAAGPRVLTVAVAASLKPAFEELAARFQVLNPGVQVRPTYGASGTFFAQLANGAPFDLFLSADAGFPARIVEKGLADGKAFAYAQGRLVVWVPAGSPIDLENRGLAALGDPTVRKIAIANPDVAPYGRAAREALERAGLLAALQPRLVSGQGVAQAAQFVESGSAQAGFLPLSLARAPPLSAKGRAWEVPPGSHAPIEQAGVVLRSARQPALARALVAFLTGDEGRAILARNGYGLPARRP
jgi:molybdate transport system substrate-binding protein